MNDLYNIGVPFIVGVFTPYACSWLKERVTSKKDDKEMRLAMIRLDAELEGIKNLISKNKPENVQLLNDQLEKDLGNG